MVFFKLVDSPDEGEPWAGSPVTIYGYDTVTWVDRYREAGSIEIVGPMSAGLQDQLPVGTLVSHTDSYGLCMIESHTFELNENNERIFKGFGRSLEAWLTYRVVGEFEADTAPNADDGPPVITLQRASTWFQARDLIRTHGLGSEMTYLKCDTLTGIANDLVFVSPAQTEKALQRKDVYSTLLELLKLEDLGVRVLRGRSSRPNLSTADGPMDAASTYFVIHAGKDRTSEVVFSWQRNDIVDLNYLETNVQNITSVKVVGKYGAVNVTPPGSKTKYGRRTVVVDGSEIDKDWNAGQPWEPQKQLLIEFGTRVIGNRTGLSLTDAKFGQNNPYAYGVDYNIGDLVLLEGDQGQLELKRVTEHTTVITRDEVTEIPTFTTPGGE